MTALIERLGAEEYAKRYGTRAADFYAIVKDELPPRDWLIPHYNARGLHTVLAGGSGSAKTMILLQLAVQATQDRPSEFPHDLELDVPPLKITIVDAEMGPDEYNHRVWDTGLRQYMYPERMQYVNVAGLDLTDEDDLYYVMEQIDGSDLVIFDALKSLTPSMTENDNDDMSETVGIITDITRSMPVGIVTIHHLGKDGRFRGASAIKDRCDALLAWKTHYASDSNTKLRCLVARGEWTKVRVAKESEDRWFEQTDTGLLVPAAAPEKEGAPRVQYEQYKAAICALLPFEGTKKGLADKCGTNSHNNTWTDAYNDVAAVIDGAHVARQSLPDAPARPEI